METQTENTQTAHDNQSLMAFEGEESIVFLTPKAVEMVKETMANENFEDHSLRVAVVGGGCSGYQYALNFDQDVAEDDVCWEQEGVKIVVDQYSAGYLKGTVVDYVMSLNGAGYKFNNPTAKRTCGCGSSFAVE